MSTEEAPSVTGPTAPQSAAQPVPMDLRAEALAAMRGPEPSSSPPDRSQTSDDVSAPSANAAPPTDPASQPPAEKRDADYWRARRDADVETRQLREQVKEAAQIRQQLEQARKDPTQIARLLGVDPADLAFKLLGADTGTQPRATEPAEPVEAKQLKAEIEALKQQLAGLVQESTDTKANAIQRGHKANIAHVIEQGADQYELVHSLGAEGVERAYRLADELAKRSGVRATGDNLVKLYTAAVETLEEDLTEQERSRVERLKATKKLGGLFGVAPAPHRPAPGIPAPQGGGGAPRPLTEAEIRAEALLAMRGG